MLELHEQGLSYATIEKRMGVSSTTIKRIILGLLKKKQEEDDGNDESTD